jgi:hypothetical protein
LRQRSQTGADFHHGLSWLGVNRVNDGFNDDLIGQEMLTESLAGDVFAVFQGVLRYCGASRIST